MTKIYKRSEIIEKLKSNKITSVDYSQMTSFVDVNSKLRNAFAENTIWIKVIFEDGEEIIAEFQE